MRNDMKIFVRNCKARDDEQRELVVDVSGMSRWEAEDFVNEVRRRVTLKRRSRAVYGRDDDYCEDRSRRRRDRQQIDLNINVRGD